jgi:hypothetical protein
MNRKQKSRRMNLFTISILAVQLAVAFSIPQLAAAPLDNKEDGDNAPIQVGYVVVTPPEGAEGITVFETFGRHHGGETQPAGVLPSAMTTHAVLFVNTSGRLSRNVGVAIANPGSGSAEIGLKLYDDQGGLLADYASSNAPLTVNPGEQVSKYVTELFESQPEVLRDFTGTLDLTSSVPVAVIGIRARGENFSTLPVTSLSGPSEDSGAIILAHFAVGGGWATEIVVANTSDAVEPVTVRIDLFDQEGNPMVVRLDDEMASSFTREVPRHGVVTLAPRNDKGDSDF